MSPKATGTFDIQLPGFPLIKGATFIGDVTITPEDATGTGTDTPPANGTGTAQSYPGTVVPATGATLDPAQTYPPSAFPNAALAPLPNPGFKYLADDPTLSASLEEGVNVKWGLVRPCSADEDAYTPVNVTVPVDIDQVALDSGTRSANRDYAIKALAGVIWTHLNGSIDRTTIRSSKRGWMPIKQYDAWASDAGQDTLIPNFTGLVAIEGGGGTAQQGGDRHFSLFDADENKIYEAGGVYAPGTWFPDYKPAVGTQAESWGTCGNPGFWVCGTLAIWDAEKRTFAQRPDGKTSSVASANAIWPYLTAEEELAWGIMHRMRATGVMRGNAGGGPYVDPASGSAGRNNPFGEDQTASGQCFILKDEFTLAGGTVASANANIVFENWKRFGQSLHDNGAKGLVTTTTEPIFGDIDGEGIGALQWDSFYFLKTSAERDADHPLTGPLPVINGIACSNGVVTLNVEGEMLAYVQGGRIFRHGTAPAMIASSDFTKAIQAPVGTVLTIIAHNRYGQIEKQVTVS